MDFPLAPSNIKDMFHTKGDILEPTVARERFRKHFDSASVEEQDQKWSELWDDGEFLPWDKGTASPALVDLMATCKDNDSVFTAHQNGLPTKRKRALGCGRGYDVLLLAQHGYDTVGVDVSCSAIESAKHWVNSRKGLGETKASSGAAPEGTMSFAAGDFFKDDWVESLGIDVNGGFDLIYDYAFLVALNPSLRAKVAARMTQLLAPKSGLLIALEYPLFRSVESGGPPHAIRSEDYEQLFGSTFEKKLHFRPERNHKVGEGSDMISVWERL